MQFTALKQTTGGMLLLKSDSGEPIAQPTGLSLGRQRVGKVVETIGRVKDAFYLAVVERGSARELVGKRLSACKP